MAVLHFRMESAYKYSNVTRGCNFGHEQELRLFSTYSRENCETEHKIQAIVDACNCRPFTMPGQIKSDGLLHFAMATHAQ